MPKPASEASKANLSQIRSILEEGLSPRALHVEDESHRHAGHIGNPKHHGPDARGDGGVTHLRVRVVADAFAGKSRIERHRMVNALLEGEIAKGLHAIAIEAKTPQEAPDAA